MKNNRSWLKPSIELTLSTTLWGYGFVASRVCLGTFGELPLVFYRFAPACVICFFILSLMHFRRGPTGYASLRAAWKSSEIPRLLKMSCLSGLMLFIGLYFGTWGLRYTTISKNAFITVLYVIIVPLFMMGIGKKFSRLLWISVILAVFGSALLNHLSLDELNFGDALTFICCLATSAQIIYLEYELKKLKSTALLFHALQCFWISLFTGLAVAVSGGTLKFPTAIDTREALNLSFLILGPSCVAFLAQVRAQKIVSATFASLIYLLESPFASLFAWLTVDEQLDLTQITGGSLIVSACLFAIFTESIHARRLLSS